MTAIEVCSPYPARRTLFEDLLLSIARSASSLAESRIARRAAQPTQGSNRVHDDAARTAAAGARALGMLPR